MTAGKKLMRAGGALTLLGLLGLVVGATMLAYSAAFGADAQREVALLVAAVGAATAIAGVSIVCMGLVLQPSRTRSKSKTKRDRCYVPAVHRATYARPARRTSPVLTGEQPVTTS